MAIAGGTPRLFPAALMRAAGFGRLLATLAALVATVGAAIPLGMMIHGAVFESVTYVTWTWPAIPAVWLGCLGAAWLTTKHVAGGALLLSGAAGAGAWSFEQEYGVYTFGAVWIIAIVLYLSESIRRVPNA